MDTAVVADTARSVAARPLRRVIASPSACGAVGERTQRASQHTLRGVVLAVRRAAETRGQRSAQPQVRNLRHARLPRETSLQFLGSNQRVLGIVGDEKIIHDAKQSPLHSFV